MGLFINRKKVVKNVTRYNMGWGTTLKGVCPTCGFEVTRYHNPAECPACKTPIKWPAPPSL